MTGENASPPRPPRCQIVPERIPIELRSLAQWVLWRYEFLPNDRRWTKRPKTPTGNNASSTNAHSWSSFETVCARHDADRSFDGIGFVFSKDDPFCGIDLDKVIDTRGELASWACDAVKRLDGYTELSVSHAGLHVIVQATLHGGGRKKILDAKLEHAIEIYDRARYFCMTGLAYQVAS